MRTCSPCGGWAGLVRCCSRSSWCRRSRARPPGLRLKASRSSSTASRRCGEAASGSSVTSTRAIPTAQCGTVSVPVDYAKPEGAQAQLAVIRIPATGERIGVLVVNPGGPGASAVDTVASMGASLADTDILRRFDLVGIDPRGRRPFHAGAALPHRRRVRRVPPRADGRLQPRRRRPHRSALPASSPMSARSGWARSSSPTSGPRRRRATWTSCARRWARTRSTISASPTAPNSARRTPSGTPTACGRWFSTAPSTRAWIPIAESIRQMAGFQTAFNDYAADCAQSAGCPLGTDPAKFVDRYHELVDPLVNKPGRDVGSARPELPGRDHRHRQRALHAALLAVPDQRAAGPAARHRRRRPAAAGRRLPAPRRSRATTRTCRMRSPRFAASTRRTRPTRRCGPTPIGRSARPRRSWRTATFTGFAPRDVCAMWPVPPTSTSASSHLARVPARSSSSPPRTIPATPYQAGVDLARQMGAALITFDGTQHTVVFNGDAVRRHRGGELPHRLRRAARRSALLAAKRIGRVTQN